MSDESHQNINNINNNSEDYQQQQQRLSQQGSIASPTGSNAGMKSPLAIDSNKQSQQLNQQQLQQQSPPNTIIINKQKEKIEAWKQVKIIKLLWSLRIHINC